MMRRREFLAASVGSLVVGVTSTAFARTSQLGPGIHPASNDETAAQRYGKERRFAQTPFGRIAYIDRGTGPAVLFLHGFPLNGFQWRGAIDRLCDSRRCLAPDLMGLGHTEVATAQAVTPSAQADMLIAFLDRLSVQDVDLIANDSGGAVAQLLVTRYPKRVRSLLLTNCDVEIDSPPTTLESVIESAQAGVYPDLWLEPWLNHKDVARLSTGLGGMCYTDPVNLTDAAIQQYLAPLVATPERKALVNRYASGLAPNPLLGIEQHLRKCTVPVRIIWGMSDTIFSTGNPGYLASVLPHITGIRRIKEAKVFFPEEFPAIIAAEARVLWT